MSSRTHRDQGPETAPVPSVPAEFPVAADQGERDGGRDHRRRWPVVVLAVALVLALAAAGYLLALARAWEDRAVALEGTSRDLGAELGQVRADLEESRGTLALVESQLEVAQEQIHELADAVAQTGDDREVQRQVAEYQRQLSANAAAVAGAMDECIAGQEDLITHLEEEARPAPSASPSASDSEDAEDADEEPGEPEVDLAALREQVTGLCARAEEAHTSLEEEVGSQ
ncbi:hypothetical protein SAMN05216184_10538 [Georgenia satyanarayanai]|uniref:Uncharacterized protein n=1 Tax=Georgenia satyanarayanai TaxID=860221 RepID=A0A2Y9AC46_9MICO|nr:hypothetical protein [Georgenia satyanarayanai]PYF99795.1 hypothetical protein A8987_10538 [Georgenia satyanarayanai]SSA41775.1 hypothetical protein SAMN05216184_10538 [Georgenia satyanarayanai]